MATDSDHFIEWLRYIYPKFRVQKSEPFDQGRLLWYQKLIQADHRSEENETNIEHSSAEQRVNTLMISETELIFRVVK